MRQDGTTRWNYATEGNAMLVFILIPLCVQYVENIYAKRQASPAFEQRILQLIDYKMV
jgi:hypothetical protein